MENLVQYEWSLIEETYLCEPHALANLMAFLRDDGTWEAVVEINDHERDLPHAAWSSGVPHYPSAEASMQACERAFQILWPLYQKGP